MTRTPGRNDMTLPATSQQELRDNPRGGGDVSNVAPRLNQEDRIVAFSGEIALEMWAQMPSSEAVFADSGAGEKFFACLSPGNAGEDCGGIVNCTPNFGQTNAMASSFACTNGWVVVPIDGDEQDNKHRLAGLLGEVESWDSAWGCRNGRKDLGDVSPGPPIIANHQVKQFSWTPDIQDSGCSHNTLTCVCYDD